MGFGKLSVLARPAPRASSFPIQSCSEPLCSQRPAAAVASPFIDKEKPYLLMDTYSTVCVTFKSPFVASSDICAVKRRPYSRVISLLQMLLQ